MLLVTLTWSDDGDRHNIRLLLLQTLKSLCMDSMVEFLSRLLHDHAGIFREKKKICGNTACVM